MQIILRAFRPVNNKALSITKQGDTLIFNGESFDFSQLVDGATLPKNAIESEWIYDNVERVGGELVVPVLLPIKRNASEAARWPEPIVVTADGPVQLPE